jgi:hypothetical protein
LEAKRRMRGAAGGVPYWILVGVLTTVGIYFSVLYDSPPYFFLAALVMAVIGAWWPGPRYSWAALVAFGGLPALLLTSSLLEEVARADWSCSKISFRPGGGSAYGGSSQETVYCLTIPGQLIVTVAIFWAITLLGAAALLYVLWRARPPADSRVTLSGFIGIGVILLVVVGGIAFRAVDAAAPPPPEERVGMPPNGLPTSCSGGQESAGASNSVSPRARDRGSAVVLGNRDVGVFNGVGDSTIPELEMLRGGWYYVYASTGSGTFKIEVLDEEGNTVPSSTVSGVAGDEGRSTRLEAKGTFRIKVDADGLVGHTVRVCYEGDPYGGNRGSPDRRSDSRERLPPPRSGVEDPEGCPDFGSCDAPTNDEPVPDVVGMKLEEACRTLDRSGYGGVFAGGPVDDPAKLGRVVGQHPPPGSTDFEGRLVHLLVSRSSSDRPLQPPPGCVNNPG